MVDLLQVAAHAVTIERPRRMAYISDLEGHAQLVVSATQLTVRATTPLRA